MAMHLLHDHAHNLRVCGSSEKRAPERSSRDVGSVLCRLHLRNRLVQIGQVVLHREEFLTWVQPPVFRQGRLQERCRQASCRRFVHALEGVLLAFQPLVDG
eukprot:TRINITY_DN60456_c0_g1_i1.p2 TRINITY_DN60456_c0_g1~~TRINITY_DN60456_c0_g1_i1.p2  ORF type:complete len:101 (+),score=15.94 TRINITY_DN60456_c0_g1_i1:303-605(+)